MTLRSLTSPELVLLRTAGQHSRLFLAGTETPPVVFAAQINQIFITHDMQAQVTYDSVTTGTHTNILPGMTLWIGSAAGLNDIGEARIRKTPTDSILYIGRESELALADNQYLTVIDEMRLWPRHVMIDDGVIKIDQDIAYSDQHTNFDPVPIMGPDAVIYADTYPVTVLFPEADESWIFDSTLSAKLWTVTAGTLANADTFAPILTIEAYPANGLIRVALKLTGANGKEFTGYRYVHVYDAAHPPVTVFQLNSFSGDHENGGFEFDVTMYGSTAKTSIRDRAPIILFAKDFYGTALQSIGQVAGRENIVVTGWIDGESIEQDPIAGTLRFTARGANYWLDKMPGYPSGVRLAKNTPALWTDMTALTVDRAVWHLLHWRSTATAVMDVRLTGDARLSAEFAPTSSALWQQIKEIATVRILAVPGVDPYGRLYLNCDPQVTPEVNRTWPILLNILKRDWHGKIDLRREVVHKIAMLNQSGIAVDASGSATAFFSLANGHTFKHFGDVMTMDGLLLSDQEQANELAGLQMAWKNNEFPQIDIALAANNRMFTLFPNQFASITIDVADTLRGIAYSGNLIPRSINYEWNAETGVLSPTISFEAETFPELAVDGDVPGIDDDLSYPPIPPFPPPPEPPVIEFPPTVENPDHPTTVVMASNKGVLYTTNFNDDFPVWYFMNGGLLFGIDTIDIVNLVVTPSGALYIHLGLGQKIMRASGLGGFWTTVAQSSDFGADVAIIGMGLNPIADDTIAIVAGGGRFEPEGKFKLMTGGVLSGSATTIAIRGEYYAAITFSSGRWIIAGSVMGVFATPWYWILSTGGGVVYHSPITGVVGEDAAARYMVTAGTGGNSYQWDAAAPGGYCLFTSGGTTVTRFETLSPRGLQGIAVSPVGLIAIANDGLDALYLTTDAGYTWSPLTATIPIGSDVIENCRDNNRFIFGGGIIVRLTLDLGMTYFDKMGNLGYIAPLIDISHIRFIA